MTTTASVQDIDSFIRLQKEKLSKEKNGYQTPPPQHYPTNLELDYNKRLDNYLNLPRNFDNYVQPYNNMENIINNNNNNSSIANNPLEQYSKQSNKEYLNERNNRAFKENDDPQQTENFLDKFGKHDALKSKLKNDLHNEYNEYLQKKNVSSNRGNNKNMPVNDEYYATLPLKGMDSAKERAKKQRNYEYQILQNKLENSEKSRKIEWWKDRNSPNIKPYSRHENGKEPSNDINVISDRRLGSNDYYQYDQPQQQQQQQMMMNYREPPSQQLQQYQQQMNNYRAPPPPPAQMSIPQTNSYENMRQMPLDAWRSPIPPANQIQSQMPSLLDASLADILKRPPVGYKPQPQFPPYPSNQQQMDMYEPSYSKYPHSQSPTNYQSQPQTQSKYLQQPQQNNNYSNNNNSNRNNNGGISNRKAGQQGTFGFTDEQAKDEKAQKAREYQEELQKQVREKQMQKQKEKDEQERLDKKISIENSNYNPYGRGGGGAPIKDKDGNVVANLAQVKPDSNPYTPRDMGQQMQYAPAKNYSPDYNQPAAVAAAAFNPNNYGLSMNNYGGQSSNSNENLMQPFGFGDKNMDEQGQKFARGGNGIFGEGKSDDQKRQQEKYQAELQKQIEEKKRQKEEEKERQRIEDEKEYKRIMEQQQRIKAELEEEERKKKAKEEQGRRLADDAKRLADEKKRQESMPVNKKSNQVKQMNKKFQRANNPDNNSIQESQLELQQQQQEPSSMPEFRSNSPPVPAAAKKISADIPKVKPIATKTKQKETTANYYVTESRLNLNLASPTPHHETSHNHQLDRPFSGNAFHSVSGPKKSETTSNLDMNLPTKPLTRRTMNRSPSQVSNNEVLTQLKNLKKHLHKEQLQVENQLNNANNKMSIGQMGDIRHSILNVKTPPGDRDVFYSAMQKEPASIRRENSDFQKTYRKYLDTPPLQGGLEPSTYYRDNTVLLDNQKKDKDDMFHNDLQKQAHDRQKNRMNQMNADDQVAASNQQRLKKLRDIEDDNLSLADPNEVLNKFLSRNNRQPSAATLHDDTWLKNPA